MENKQISLLEYVKGDSDLSPEDVELLVKAKQKEAEDAKRAIQRLANQQERERLAENPPSLPEGEYRVIVIDPPWKMEKIKMDVRPNQVDFDYPTMTVDEIKSLQLPLASDAWVFMWTTQKYLPYAFEIVKEWALTYRFVMVWHKSGGFQICNYPQFNGEFIICGSQGNPKFVDAKAFNATFYAKRSGHSIKPTEFYRLIERVTIGPRLDMFARRRIKGFDSWGNEVDNAEPDPDQMSILEDYDGSNTIR